MLTACASPYIDHTGQRHLLEESRLATDWAALLAQWYREDALEAKEWAARGEEGELERARATIGRQGCWCCIAYRVAPDVFDPCSYHEYGPSELEEY